MKKVKSTIAILICLLMATSCFGMTSFAADEVPDGWTEVKTIDDLYAIRNDLSGNYILTQDLDLTAALADNGDYNDGNGWTPIGFNGSSYSKFLGVLDGNGHTITGFRINLNNINSGYTDNYFSGLFCRNSGTIKNLVFEDVDYTVSVDTNKVYAGVLCGYNTGVINNCTIKSCNILILGTGSYRINFGTIAGANEIEISNCDVIGNITTNGTYGTYSRFGGIVGHCEPNSNSTEKAIISNCSTKLNMNLTMYQPGGYYTKVYPAPFYVGEIVGEMIKTTVKNCYTQCVTDFTFYGGPAASTGYYDLPCYIEYGCVAGTSASSTTIANVYSSSSIKFNNGSLSKLTFGGIVSTGNGVINNSYFAGDVDDNSSSSYGKSIGGIIGTITDSVSTNQNNCYYINSFEKGVGSGKDLSMSKSPAMMKKQIAFTGFDFENTWIMYPCSEYKYPQLRSIPQDTSEDNHVTSNPLSKTEPTCTQNGVIRGVCDFHGVEFTELIPATGHKWETEFTIDIVADCENDGSKSIHCTKCEEKKNETAITKLGHDWTEWTYSNVDNPCDEGVATRYCKTCNKTTEIPYQASEHIIVADKAVASTCEESGLTEGSHCAVCGKVFVAQETIPAFGHKSVTEKGTPATCTTAGSTDKEYCSVCNATLKASTVIKATGHKAGAPVSENVVDATCTKAGSYDSVVYCSVCNSEISRDAKVIPALGHTYGSWVVTKAATETSEGLRVKTCSVCGDKVSEKIAKLPSTAKQTKIAIRNMSKYNGKTLDYKATITFYADVTDSAGNKIEWHVTGANKTLNSDGSCTIKQATKDFTISCSTKDANGKDVTSETETIKINTSFFGRIMSFFKGLFGKLPVYDQ